MSEVKMGKAKFHGEFKKKVHTKLKDGEQAYRILPPLFDLADEGKWSMFWNVHFGYRTTQNKMITFQSPLQKNRKTRMVEVPDAALERIETFKAKMEAARLSGNKVVFDALNELVGQKGRFNIDNNHHMNVIDENGVISELKIRHRCKVALDLAIKTLRDKGIDPLSADNGRFFVFRRSGMGLDTTFQVSVKTKTLNVEGVGDVEQAIVHVLTDDIIARLKDEAFELDKLHRKPTSEEVAAIVKETDLKTGISPAMDIVFAPKNGAADTSSAGGFEDADADEPEAEVETTTVTTTATPAVTATVAAANVAPATPPPAATVVTKPAVAPKQAALEPSEAEFLASLGLT
jgi:hypothetical protein